MMERSGEKQEEDGQKSRMIKRKGVQIRKGKTVNLLGFQLKAQEGD